MKNGFPLVSVVMPVYNSEKYVAEAIESILNQTYKNFEFIIINDASTDNSLEIIKKYAKKDKRIKIINNKKNLKISLTLNKGVFKSKGKYIARMDSDDISLPIRIEEQVKFLEDNPEIGVVGANIEIFNEINPKTSLRIYPEFDEELRKVIFFFSPFAHPVTMFRKRIFEKTGGYNSKARPAEDLDFWFRIGAITKFANINKCLLKYRYHSKSTTGSKIREMEKNTNIVRWIHCRDSKFKFGVIAFTFNLLHLISIYIIPSDFKVWLFFKLRDVQIRKKRD